MFVFENIVPVIACDFSIAFFIREVRKFLEGMTSKVTVWHMCIHFRFLSLSVHYIMNASENRKMSKIEGVYIW